MDFNEFKDKAAEILNLDLDGYKIKRVRRRTKSLMKRKNIDGFGKCLKKIKNDRDFRATYLNHLTINTTEFFRNPDNFVYLRDTILPNLFKQEKKVKIWSAPCANGAEPYTLALILKEMEVNSRKFKILASDIDSDILESARKGIYSKKSIKNVPKKIKEKYFTPVRGKDNQYQISSRIKKMVKFEQKDLIRASYSKNWHLILCRNFFIYLTRELKKSLTQKFVDSLKKDGYLFLGNTEFIFNPGQYNLKKENLSFYQKIK